MIFQYLTSAVMSSVWSWSKESLRTMPQTSECYKFNSKHFSFTFHQHGSSWLDGFVSL